ncbi:uncharacterized protein ACBT44_014199 [Syngnathus typhle]
MKVFSVIIMLAFLFTQEGCTFSTNNGDPNQHLMNARAEGAAEIHADQWKEEDVVRARDEVLETFEMQSDEPKMDYGARPVRNARDCRWCCNCCGKEPTWCGLCCDW